MKFSNVLVLCGAIVAICALTAGVVVALCVTNSAVDHTPVATTVLTAFATTLAALVALLKAYVNGQDAKEVKADVRANTVITQSVANAVGATCKDNVNAASPSQPRP